MAAAAMGAENVAFARDGEVQIGLTYMTGTLVKFAQRLVQALKGYRDTGWLSFLVLWAGLVGGGVVGAITFGYLGFSALWFAVFILVGMSFYNPTARSFGVPS